jgi:hypothetical protein
MDQPRKLPMSLSQLCPSAAVFSIRPRATTIARQWFASVSDILPIPWVLDQPEEKQNEWFPWAEK